MATLNPISLQDTIKLLVGACGPVSRIQIHREVKTQFTGPYVKSEVDQALRDMVDSKTFEIDDFDADASNYFDGPYYDTGDNWQAPNVLN